MVLGDGNIPMDAAPNGNKTMEETFIAFAIHFNHYLLSTRGSCEAQEEQFKECKTDMYSLVLYMIFTPEWL